jgi:NADH-quinone oxidoreductase subunit J
VTLLAVTHLASASAWALYAVGAAMALAGATGVVLQRNPVHCALALVTTIFGIALLFIDEGADFLAAVQVIVYAGAIVILFLFVIMLLGVDHREARAQRKLKGLTPAAIVVGAVALAELLLLVRVRYWATGTKASAGALNGPGENVQKLGQSIFTAYLLPFEMTSALLVIAVVAAVVLVRRTSVANPRAERKGTGPGREPVRSSPGPAAAPHHAPMTERAPVAQPSAIVEQPSSPGRAAR